MAFLGALAARLYAARRARHARQRAVTDEPRDFGGDPGYARSGGADDEPGADPAAQQRRRLRGRFALAELLTQQRAQLAERPAAARGVQHADLGLRQRA